MNNKLLPCPFCGGEAEIVGGTEAWTPTFYDPDSGGDPYSVECKICGAMAGAVSYEVGEAIAAWNNRTILNGTYIDIGAYERLHSALETAERERDTFKTAIETISGNNGEAICNLCEFGPQNSCKKICDMDGSRFKYRGIKEGD